MARAGFGASTGAGASAAGTGAPARATAFHGSVEVSAATAKLRFVDLAEEIISALAGDPQAQLRITVEISAEFPGGASDRIRRVVSENAKSLGFKSCDWE